MIARHNNKSPHAPAGKKWTWLDLTPLAVAAAAVIGRLPALGAYWNQDDWGLLGGAIGLDGTRPSATRWLSRVGYWELMWPTAGLDPVPYAWTRLALHALSAAGVVCLARRLRLSNLQAVVAGLLVAATPLAFSPLYWAAGIQDLLCVTLAVWGLYFWTRPGPASLVSAVVLMAGAMFAKEIMLGLPVVMLATSILLPQPRSWASSIAGTALVAVAAAVAVAIARTGFATGSDAPYALGGFNVVIGHLMTYGWWLLQTGPSFTPNLNTAMAVTGAALFVVWLAWGLHQRRHDQPVPLLAFAGGLVTLAPLLPLTRHLAPDLAYPVAVYGALALACLVPRRRRPYRVVVAGLVLAAIAWGFLGMRERLALRGEDGTPADPLVRRTAASWQATRQFPRLPIGDAGLVIVQPPLAAETARMAAALGESWVTGSLMYHALGGSLAPRVILGPDTPVVWTNGLRQTPEHALVLVDTGHTLKPWGFTPQALLYQALTDVGLGLYNRARLHLLRAGLLADDTLALMFDPDLLPVSLDRVVANKDAFTTFIALGAVGRSTFEINGLQTNFYRLLSACTGLDEQTLRTPTTQTSRNEP